MGRRNIYRQDYMTNSAEVAEEMVRQNEAKNEKVKEAIGQPVTDYLARLKRLTADSCGKFYFIEITEKDVRVGHKESE